MTEVYLSRVERSENLNREPVKLHLGCGDVYLAGWLNIDAAGEVAGEAPDLVEANMTTLDRYYQRPYRHRAFGHDKRGRVVVDLRTTVTELPMFEDGTVDEILTVNLVDHLRLQDLPAAVAEWRRVLTADGILIIDVGDACGNAELLLNAKDRASLEWALRLIYCHSRDQHDSHHWGFTPSYLAELMAEWGFSQVWTQRDFIEHVYPAFQSCFRKTEP